MGASHEPEADILVELIEHLKEKPDTPTFSLIGTWMGTEKDHLAKRMLALDHILPAQGIQAQFKDAMVTLHKQFDRTTLESELREIQSIALTAMEPFQKDRIREILFKLQSLS